MFICLSYCKFWSIHSITYIGIEVLYTQTTFSLNHYKGNCSYFVYFISGMSNEVPFLQIELFTKHLNGSRIHRISMKSGIL